MKQIMTILSVIVFTYIMQTVCYAGCECDDWLLSGGYCVDYIKSRIPSFQIPKNTNEIFSLKNRSISDVAAGDVAVFELSDHWHVAYVEKVYKDWYDNVTSIDVSEMNFGRQLSFGEYRNVWKRNNKSEWKRAVCCGVTDNFNVIDLRNHVALNTVKQVWSPSLTVTEIISEIIHKEAIIEKVKDTFFSSRER